MTPEVGQYWLHRIRAMSSHSLWQIKAFELDDRGEGLWVDILLVSASNPDRAGHLAIGAISSVSIEDFEDDSKWNLVDAEDLPLLVLGDL